MRRWLAAAALALVGACADPRPPGATLRLWHCFSPPETARLNEDLGEIQHQLGIRVLATYMPFNQGQNRLTDIIERNDPACPDLARIDATWLPAMAAVGLLRPVEDPGLLEGLTPQAAELARWDRSGDAASGARAWGITQSIDGLALVHSPRVAVEAGPAWPPTDLDGLERAARALTRGDRKGLSVRADGYWFIAYLRAAGAELFDAHSAPRPGAVRIAAPEASAALARYAKLAGPDGIGVAMPPGGDESGMDIHRFVAGEVAVVVGGPWTVVSLAAAGAGEIAVTPYPRGPGDAAAAPRGGHVYVVPRCAAHPAEAWRLASELTTPGRQASWSRQLNLIPTREAALETASPLARSFAAALLATRPLPRDPITPMLFDDLTPAIDAVLAGDATPEAALAGVERAWQRLLASEETPRP